MPRSPISVLPYGQSIMLQVWKRNYVFTWFVQLHLLFLGVESVSMQGCFTNAESCNQTECISTDSPKKPYKFCCCRGDNCNAEYKWKPSLIVAAEVEGI